MSIQELATQLSKRYPDLSLEQEDRFYWSPVKQKVFYNSSNNTPEGLWALLHESGHALLAHKIYRSDIELVKMELAAWEKAKTLGNELAIQIDEDHVQDCIDSYRDWLFKRSLCPHCQLSGIQADSRTYECVFCHERWHVSADRFCRPYRRRSAMH